MQRELERGLEAAAHESMSKLVKKGKRGAVGIKLMYDHVPAVHRSRFVQWVACSNITIIHLVRDAAVESFWSLQARLVDTIAAGKYTGRSFDARDRGKMQSNRVALVLDEEEAQTYVRMIEGHRREYRHLLKLYGGSCVPYLEVSYEQLVASAVYFDTVLYFLGVAQPALRRRANHLHGSQLPLQKQHPGTCSQKIGETPL